IYGIEPRILDITFSNTHQNFTPDNLDSIHLPPMASAKIPPVQSGTFSRPLGTLENFFSHIGQIEDRSNREHTSFFTALQVRFPPTLTNVDGYIMRAWEEVGRRFPALRAEISSPNELGRYKESMITVQPWNRSDFRASFSVHRNCPNVDVLFSTASPRRTTATCYWLPDPGQIVIWTAHWRTDGFGLILLAETFLSTLADSLQTGLDASLDDDCIEHPLSLPPSLEDLVHKYAQVTPDAAADADDLVKIFVDGGRSVGIPTRPGASAATPTVCERAAIRMNTEDSARLVNACRSRGVSVTSAINAALIRATARFPQDPGADSYVFFAPVNLRGPLITAGAQECSQPTGNYVSGLPLRVDGVVTHLEDGSSVPSKSFGDLAQELGALYSQDITRYRRPGKTGARAVNLLQLTQPYIESMGNIFSRFPSPGCPFPTTPVISSFGRMDGMIRREYGGSGDGTTGLSKLHVTDFWVSCDCARPMITFNPYSWSGVFTLSAAWDDSYYSKAFVVDVLEKTMAELTEGLEMGQVCYRITNGCYDDSTHT
ncbi:hypothetical protein GGR53DRAFT_525929, partial [Hypoxylon sp. FL1150]